MLGPHDFAWLLDRVADFGPEAPLWHRTRTGPLPAEFRSDPPPPPLQLLVPEALLFAGDAHRPTPSPAALFFTDRGGFLRGTRKAARQGAQVCQSLLRLQRHRQPALTLTHSAGVVFERHTLVAGAKAWSDRMYLYTTVPEEMVGASFFAGPHTSVPTGELLLSSPVEGMAYAWSEDKPEASGGIPSLGWEAVTGSLVFGGTRTMKVYKKLLTAGASHVIPMQYMWIGGVAFQPRERPELDALAAVAAATAAGGGGGGGGAANGGGRGQSRSFSGSPTRAHSREREKGAGEANGRSTPLDTSASGSASASGHGAGRRGARCVHRRGNTMLDSGGTGASVATACWKLKLRGGKTQLLSDDDVAGHFGVTVDGRMTPWPSGALLLQACFWEGRPREHPSFVYHYDALRKEAEDHHERVPTNVMNHFERYGFLTDVADHNLASSAPILFSQHLSYHCGLELVCGDFEFVRDARGQLWLTDARNLYLIHATRNVGGAPGSGPGVGAAAGTSTSETPTQKLPRYLSEEALLNLRVPEDTGNKCQRMLELMRDHYRTMKHVSGMDDMLRRTDEVVEITVPVLEGTDRKAFARTFGQKGPAAGSARAAAEGGVNAGLLLCSNRRRLPLAPKPTVLTGRGRLVAPLADPLSRDLGRPRRPQTCEPPPALALAGGPRPSTAPAGPATGEAKAAPALAGAPAAAVQTPRATQGGAKRGRPSGVRRPSSGDAMGARADNVASFGMDLGEQIEIVLGENAEKLLAFSGPGIRPDGPTLDLLGPHSARAPGAGLQERWRMARPVVRLVEVPPGAAAAAAAAAAARSTAAGRQTARGGGGGGRPHVGSR